VCAQSSWLQLLGNKSEQTKQLRAAAGDQTAIVSATPMEMQAEDAGAHAGLSARRSWVRRNTESAGIAALREYQVAP
jgi:hypothetical protein